MRCLLLLALPLLALAVDPVPEFSIDLDLPPDQRQREVARHFAEDFPNAMMAWEYELSKLMTKAERAEWVANSNVPEEYQEEIRGFAEEVGHPKVTFERVLLWNLMYEVGHKMYSSGILAMDESGRVIHGRNLDLAFDYMSGRAHRKITDLAANFTYTRSGQPVFTTPGFAGYVGLHTSLKLNGHHPWSFQQNSHSGNDRQANLAAQKTGAVPFGFYMRQLVEEDLDFKSAVLRITSTRFSAPSFFMLAGADPWEGVSLDMRRNSSDAVTNLASAQVLSKLIGRWYIIQTNEAIWDAPKDDRRPAAVQFMGLLDTPMSVNEESIMHIMRTTPLFNEQTFFSIVSMPATGYCLARTQKEYYPELNVLKKKYRVYKHIFPRI